MSLLLSETLSFTMNFQQAVVLGQYDIVDSMLAAGHNPHVNDIVTTCITGDIDMLTRLLEYSNQTSVTMKSSVQVKLSRSIQLGFVIAIANNHVDLLHHLYLHGANVNLADKSGKTPIQYAKSPEATKCLVNLGANLP